MKSRPYLVLALIVLIFRLATALPLERAGYMDASYAFHVGTNLAQGRGLVQDVVWNYLDGSTTLPQPSNLYWLPLPSILAGLAMALFGISYHAAQIPFILLSLLPPLFAFYLARRLFADNPKRDAYARMAALLTAFSGFYTIYWSSPDNFAPFAVTADVALLLIALGVRKGDRRFFFGAGIFVGLSQLSRADALLLLVVAPIVLWFNRKVFSVSWIMPLGALVVGFLLILTPWLVRNYFVIGTPFAPGGTRTLFLLNYDEFFSFDVGRITLQRYLDWGIGNILGSKFDALGFVLLVLLFGVWQIFLAPFAAVGFWKLRLQVEMQAALVYMVLLVLAMAFVFTFPATHGSMLHSTTALIAFGAVAVPPGLDAAVAWVAKRRRGWNAGQAQQFFGVGVVVIAFLFSVYFFAGGVFLPPSPDATTPLWNLRDSEYTAIDRELAARNVPKDVPVVTVDPPSFINETGRRSIYLPTESIDAIFEAAHQFGARYLVLQFDRPVTMRDLYAGNAAVDGLAPLLTTQDALGRPVTLFEITR